MPQGAFATLLSVNASVGSTKAKPEPNCWQVCDDNGKRVPIGSQSERIRLMPQSMVRPLRTAADAARIASDSPGAPKYEA